MYASEVAIYKALAAELEKTDCLTLPPVMLRFPAWSKDELLQNAKTVHVDSVEFKCEPFGALLGHVFHIKLSRSKGILFDSSGIVN